MAPILEVRDLRVTFETPHGRVRAVDGVSFDLHEGETIGLVGESGSGKSVTNLAILGLVPSPPGIVEASHVLFAGRELTRLSPGELRKLRGRDISMIFQDPMTSLNPLLTVGRQLTEVLETHTSLPRREIRTRCVKALGDVGIPTPETRLGQYPHELSGGMRQRVMIAMALLCEPQVLVADEPTTALDVTIQAQILELMKELQERRGMATILITHDLGVVAGMADRIHVMYAGRLVETAMTDPLFESPIHPYTQGLLASVPSIAKGPDERLESIPGTPPDLTTLESSCAFAARCSHTIEVCEAQTPTLDPFREGVDGTRYAACFRGDEWAEARPRAGEWNSADGAAARPENPS